MGRILRRVRQAGVYFVTSDTWQRRAIFTKPEPVRIVLDQMLDCRKRGFYELHCFVVMPEHIHVLLTPGMETSIEKALQMIKGGSAFRIKKELGYRWPIWHAGFHDRWVRNAEEYLATRKYIEANPVEARLCNEPEDYPFGSACGKFDLDPSRFG